MNYRELALGTNSRSGEQWDIWQAVYGPMGTDGYPKPIWDKLTGEIDHQVATYWKENYDLRHILKRDWDLLGPKLEGKHCWNGDHSRPNATSRLRYHQMFIKKAVERISISAPSGADLDSWRY